MAITKLSGSSLTNITKYDSFLAGNAAYDPGSYYLIERITVGSGGSSTITFSSIPSTYKHLQLRGIGRSGTAAYNDGIWLRFNSDSNSNYSRHRLEGEGTTAYADGASSAQTKTLIGETTAASSLSNNFNALICDVLDYTSTNKAKTMRILSGRDNNGTGTNNSDKGNIQFNSGAWQWTTPAAVTTITLTLSSGSNFAQYSSFALYGIKGA
jgi:hypothetical protein